MDRQPTVDLAGPGFFRHFSLITYRSTNPGDALSRSFLTLAQNLPDCEAPEGIKPIFLEVPLAISIGRCIYYFIKLFQNPGPTAYGLCGG